ncbi:MAG: lipid-A-disaccharide synthase [Alcaligenaceae bacterium]|nr:lipid-A-disaccharide synthase [Alcaligenaceae bacterium]
MSLNIAMVAGEPSGDLLASRIIQGIRQLQPTAQFSGIGGPNMQAEGMEILHPMDRLSVFGYADAIKHLPSLIRTYSSLKNTLVSSKPDVFVGVDAPDFNLRLEQKLRDNGIPTVHFVGPSIWAWRYERIHAIKKAVSHMLVLFPFEVEIYQKEGIPVTFVGHPLASQIPLVPDVQAARTRLGLNNAARILAILPGSRSSEIKMLAPRFLQTAQQLQKHDPDLQFLVPIVNEKRQKEFDAILKAIPVRNLTVFSTVKSDRPIAWDVMEASDAVLVASGTASLETALFKKPMVISYALSPLVKKLMEWKSGQLKPYVPWIGLPNILLKEFAVPEILQDEATPANLAAACINALENKNYIQEVQGKFTCLHASLKQDTARLAAQAIIEASQT